ncbi:MAG: hypothetical protein ACK56W_02660 [Pirellula sp.]|jgi:hypothetical protein|nr:hypothetical protein [Pirellula sp.]
MTTLPGHFHHDASNRLTYEVDALESVRYATICDRIVNKFDLSPAGEMVIGLDEMMREYTDGRNMIGLEWDNWSGFIVVAKNAGAETLVRAIAEFLARE